MKMKKIFALVMTAVLTISAGSVSAFAETAAADTAGTVTELTWDDTYPEVYGVSGEFIDLTEAKYKVFIPGDFQALEMTEEDKEAGFLAYYGTSDQSAMFAVQHIAADEMTIDSYEEYLKGEADVSGVERGIVNGMESISYELKDKDGAYISIFSEDGMITEFCFIGVSLEQYSGQIALMACSIQKIQ